MRSSNSPKHPQNSPEHPQNGTILQKPGLKIVQTKEIKGAKISPKPKTRRTKSNKKAKIRLAILNGEWTKYEDFKVRFGVGRSTISLVIRQLVLEGKVIKRGHKLILAKEANTG